MGSIVTKLVSHPDTPPSHVESITLKIERQANTGLWLRYHLEGSLEHLQLPDPAGTGRDDELWRTTCFELFARRPESRAYCEFNFSPSQRWAAYSFADTRDGIEPLELRRPPEIGLDASETHLALEAVVELPQDWSGIGLCLAPSAVIEEMEGTKSYWALAHPGEAPDFHHPDGFVLDLPLA